MQKTKKQASYSSYVCVYILLNVENNKAKIL